MTAFWRVHLCRSAGLSRVQDLPEVGSGPLVVCSVAFLLCRWCIAIEICLYSRFKGVFRGVWVVCVGLFVLGGLRGLWGFCVREWLGGLEVCGVFALLLSFCPFVFLSCPAFVLLSCLASFLACFPALCLAFLALWLGFWCWLGCWLSFPFGRLQIQKERAQSVSLASSLRVLLFPLLLFRFNS